MKNETENTEITIKSRASPTTHDGDSVKVGRLKSSNDNGLKDFARLARPARPKNKGIGLE